MNAAMFGFYVPNGREKTAVEQSTAPELLHLRGKLKLEAHRIDFFSTEGAFCM